MQLTESKFRIITVEENIKKYTPELSDSDIQAFVWYNRTLGIPMTGFEKWFIGGSSKTVVTALETVDYLNQQYEVVGRFQKGDEVGKVTKFENVYDGRTYVAIRKFDNSLCLVDKSKLDINGSKYETDIRDLDELVKRKSLMYLNGMYLPLHVYTNTDYDTLSRQLTKDAEFIATRFGQDVYDYHKSIISGFQKMMVNDPIKEKRFRLNPFGDIARETKYMPIDEDRETNVSDGFLSYCRSLKSSDFKLVSKDVFFERIIRNNQKISKSGAFTDDEKQALEEKGKREIADAQLECERLFSDFVCNMLDADTVKVLNIRINETYNRSLLVNTSKVPIGFKCSSMLKTFPFSLKKVQQDAFKFAISRNNFCLALTVGFGKTSTLIAILSYLIGTGTIKKPLLIVPKPVLKNWQKELTGFYTNGKDFSFDYVDGWQRNYGVLSDCGFDLLNIRNLSGSIAKKAQLQIGNKEKAIILGSYEALEKMYIGNEDVRMFVIAEWKKILEQSTEGGEEESAREATKKVSGLIAKLNEVDKDAEIDLLSLNIDSIYFDEAHRLKNLFSKVGADKSARIKSGFKGAPSNRSLRAFYISIYLQKIKGRIGFLTATPFSNSPLEVYTMLVYLNYSELVKNNVNKIINFCELFFNETLEYKVNQKNKIVSESAMKNYKNKPILYKILSNTFIYKNDPREANIKRPCIIRYPNKEIKLILTQSPLQSLQRDLLTSKYKSIEEIEAIYPEIADYIESFKGSLAQLMQSRSKLGIEGKILAASRCSALSPFAQSPLMLPYITDNQWEELYNFSPKIKFTVDTIQLINQWVANNDLPPTGFLIFANLGVDTIFTQFKEALEQICGFQTNLDVNSDDEDDDESSNKKKITYDEVEIIKGSADTDKEANRRERISDLFNKGKVKVIIGSDTIKEGLNLQTSCATLFILTPTWNSTDITQVEGRIHRQGNKYGFARVITPLVTRTLDSFTFQKYEEKQSRINDVWANDGMSVTESMDVDISPEKQKELILDDAKEIAKIRVTLLEKQEINAYNKLKDEYDSLAAAIQKSEKYKFLVGFFAERLPKIKETCEQNLSNIKTLLRRIEAGEETPQYIRSKKERLKLLVEYYDELNAKVDKAINTNAVVDLVNIFTGNFKRRSYNLFIDWYDQKELIAAQSNYQLVNIEWLLSENIFYHLDIKRETNYGYRYAQTTDASISDLTAIYNECFYSEKYVLNPEGLSLMSSNEELATVLNKMQQRINDKIAAIEKNFEFRWLGNNVKLNAKPEFLTELENTARIELDEENKLSFLGDKLAVYFTQKTNNQLKYLIEDIDTDKCEIPYEKVDITNLKTDTNITTASAIPGVALYGKLYKALLKVIGNLPELHAGFYKKVGEPGDTIMPLSVEIQNLYNEHNLFTDKQGLRLIMEQNYTQNGDLMTDPRIDFAIYNSEQLAVPLNMEQNGLGLFIEFVEDKKLKKLKNMQDCANFCINTWFPNLVEQDRTIGIIKKVASPENITNKNIASSPENINTINDAYFKENPSHVLGEQSIGFRNAILVTGTKADVQTYFNNLFADTSNMVAEPSFVNEIAEEKLNEEAKATEISKPTETESTPVAAANQTIEATGEGEAQKLKINSWEKYFIRNAEKENETLGEYIEMSPIDYLNELKPKSESLNSFIERRDRDKIEDIKKSMLDGEKFPLPSIKYLTKEESSKFAIPIKMLQDGIHRTIAAKELGIKIIPVWVENKQIAESTPVAAINKTIEAIGEAISSTEITPQESQIIWGNIVEYLQIKLYNNIYLKERSKIKKTDQIIKNVAKFFDGKVNALANPKGEKITFDELKKKYYDDKIETFVKNNKDINNKNSVMFFEENFGLNSNDFLKYYYEKYPETEPQKTFLTDKQQVFDALVDLASKAQNADQFIQYLKSELAQNFDVDINSPIAMEVLNLKKGEQEQNIANAKKFYREHANKKREERKAEAQQARTEMHMTAIESIAKQAYDDMEKEIADDEEQSEVEVVPFTYEPNQYHDLEFNYKLLSRLQQDNDYFLGHGNRYEKRLWAGSVDAQIAKMKELWNWFPNDKKPEWISYQDILDYEQKMKENAEENEPRVASVEPQKQTTIAEKPKQKRGRKADTASGNVQADEPETPSTQTEKEQIKEAIETLKISAKYGDKEAKSAIEALKTVLKYL